MLPKGLLVEKISSRKKPATVGGRTSGMVRKPSRTARSLGPAFTAFLAVKIPRKKEMPAATIPVFSEIQSGLQSSPDRNSVILIASVYASVWAFAPMLVSK